MALTTEELQQAARYIIDNQTTSVADIPIAGSIDEGATTIPVLQGNGALERVRLSDIGGTSTRLTAADITAALGYEPLREVKVGKGLKMTDDGTLIVDTAASGGGGEPMSDDEPMSDEEIGELIGEAWA